jgi:transcriptional regulator with XRE-family HTH domain
MLADVAGEDPDRRRAGGALRAARLQRGWSQARVVNALVGHLGPIGALGANADSLKVYVSEWENGRRTVGEDYRAALRAIFGLTDAELFGIGAHLDAMGSDGSSAYDELRTRIEHGGSVDAGMVDALRQQTELFRTVDRQLGAPRLVDQMAAHLATLDEALVYAVLPDARRPVAEVLSAASTLAGWQSLDVGAPDRAWRHYETARRAAVEAERHPLQAHAMGEQAYVLSDLGQPVLAVELVRAALTTAAGRAPTRLLAWLHAAEAELCALAGMRDEGLHALELAEREVPDGSEARDEAVPGLFLNNSHFRRWRGDALALMGDVQAIDDLYAALERFDDTFARAEVGVAYQPRSGAHPSRRGRRGAGPRAACSPPGESHRVRATASAPRPLGHSGRVTEPGHSNAMMCSTPIKVPEPSSCPSATSDGTRSRGIHSTRPRSSASVGSLTVQVVSGDG